MDIDDVGLLQLEHDGMNGAQTLPHLGHSHPTLSFGTRGPGTTTIGRSIPVLHFLRHGPEALAFPHAGELQKSTIMMSFYVAQYTHYIS